MSIPNLNYPNLDARYSKPGDVDTKISAQAATDAAQYAQMFAVSGSDLSSAVCASWTLFRK